MKLSSNKKAIIIKPDNEFASKILDEQWKLHNIYGKLHPTITENPIQIIDGKMQIDTQVHPLKFLGGNQENLCFSGTIEELYKKLELIVLKHSNNFPKLGERPIDNLLYLTLFGLGKHSDKTSDNIKLSYLKQLIKLYLDLKENKVLVSDTYSELSADKMIDFEDLTEFDKEQYIANDESQSVIARQIGGIGFNKLVYISSDSKIAIQPRNSECEQIIIPPRLAIKIHDLILTEIIDEHKKNDTTFYQTLKRNNFTKIEFKRSFKHRQLTKNTYVLHYLILLMDDYLNTIKPVSGTKKDNYLLIFDILLLLNFIDKDKGSPADRYGYIYRTVADYTAKKHLKSQRD